MESLHDCRLYGILDLGYVAAAKAMDTARRMVEGGVDILQLRAKQTLAPDILALAEQIRPLTAAANVPFIINDYPWLVPRTGADGAHLGQDDGPRRRFLACRARRTLGHPRCERFRQNFAAQRADRVPHAQCRVGRGARIGLRTRGLARTAQTRRAGQFLGPADDW